MDGSHHHLMTNILLLDTTDPDSDWKDVIKQTCVRILMQMAGSVCSSAQNCHFYICICIWQMFLKKHFLNWQFLEHIESILVLPGTHKPPSYAPPHCVSPECSVITSHPVASCHIITVQHGTSVGQDQTVTQLLWGQLHLQGWGGPGGGAIGSDGVGLLWREVLLLLTVLPSFLHIHYC